MERTMSVEEKIKRAEEIYARRHERDSKQTATLNLNDNNKKDIKLLRKLILQVIACLLIYLIVYTVQNNNYIFSEDFIKKAKEILSYDTNFTQIYNDAKNSIVNFFNKEEKTDEGIGGSTEETNIEIQSYDETTENSETIQLSEEEQQILKIKNTTSFIKPIEGKITSKYGQREPTTQTVPKNHTGTDIAANTGTKIKAATDGEVVLASSEGDYRKSLKDSNWRSKYYLCTLQ